MSEFERNLSILSIVGFLLLVVAYSYYRNEFKETTLVEAKSDIDTSTLNPKNPGCTITLPDGKTLDTSKDQLVEIPKGTFITSECFKTKPTLKPVEPESTQK